MEKHYKYFLQENNFDCGVASLLTIFNNIGLSISREKLLEVLNTSDQGISAYELVKASKHFNINARGFKGDITMLKEKNLPCICHTVKDESLYHYIVVLEKNNKTIKIMDPSSGLEEITYKEFNDISTGIFLVFDKEKQKKSKDNRFKKIILKIYKDNKKLILTSISLSIIFTIISLLFNYYLKTILTFLNSNNKTLLLIFCIFLVIAFLKNTTDYLKNNIILKLNNNIDASITSKVIKHILNLPYQYFIKKTTGELISITNDIENFKEIIIKIFIIGTVDFMLLGLLIIYISFFNPLFMTLFTILLIIFIAITVNYQYAFNDKFLKLKNSRIKFSSSLIDSFTSYDTIKNLHIENKVSKNVNNDYQKVISTNKVYTKKYYDYHFYLGLLEEGFYLLIILVSSLSFMKINELDIVLLSNLFYMALNLIRDICESVSLYKMYQTSVIKVLDILEIKEEQFISSKLSEINKIEFKNVSYKKGEKDILRNVNFTITKNKNLFVTGESGIGKSTLIKLLLNYDTPTKGEIKIDGLNVKDLSLEFIRNNITYVSQNETLFIETIYKNLSIVNNDEEEIQKAVETVKLNKAFDIKTYILEENGLNISGGERKKIILARALLKAKNILVLDETFNEIDVEEEALIIKNIKKNYPNLTIVLISHRNNNQNLFEEKIEIKKED